MSLKGKLVEKIEILSDGDVFHELFRYKPHHISNISPGKVQSCDIREGEFGTVGSVINWNYTHDGKPRVTKVVIDAIGEAKKSVTFRVIEGDIAELYKTFIITIHVDTAGETNTVTWTLEFEKLNDNVPNPSNLMEFALHLTKDIETHHLK